MNLATLPPLRTLARLAARMCIAGAIALSLTGASAEEDAFKLADHGLGKYFPPDVSLGMKGSDLANSRPELRRFPSLQAPGKKEAKFDLMGRDPHNHLILSSYIEIDGRIRAAKYIDSTVPVGEIAFPNWGEVIERRKVVLGDKDIRASIYEVAISKLPKGEFHVAAVRTKSLTMIIAFDPKFLGIQDFFVDASEKPKVDKDLEEARKAAESMPQESEVKRKVEPNTPDSDDKTVTPKADPPEISPDE